MARDFENYDDFFAFYVQQHSHPGNRLLHALGTTLGISVLIAALVLGHPWLALLWIPIGYAFAWTGHFLLEGNRPATFGHPWWSFLSDFRMLALMFTGRLDPWLKRASTGRVAPASPPVRSGEARPS
jgi:hypothetical protein